MGAVVSASPQDVQPQAKKTPTPFSQMQVAPANLSFKPVTVGTTGESRSFSVKDIGTATLDVTVANPASSDFTITQGGGQTTLQPKGSPLLVTVLFAPNAAGTLRDSISVTSDATKGRTATSVTLVGVAKPTPTPTSTKTATPTRTPTSTPTPFGQMQITPANLGFQQVNFGKKGASDSRSFSVKDIGTGVLHVTVANPVTSDFTITQGGGQTTLQPKGSPLLVTVLFAPQAAGTFRDSISITSDATKGRADTSVALSGVAKGIPPTPTSTPSATPTTTTGATSTATATATMTATATVTATETATATATKTATATATATGTATPTATSTATETATATATETATATATATETATAIATNTATTTDTPTPTPTPTAGASFTGSVSAGGLDVSGAAVTFYAVGDSGYGSAATSLSTASTDSDGNYTVLYNCPSNSVETYAVALGGDAGNGTNSAIGLIAPIGPCGDITSSTTVVIDEFTTAAAEVALANSSTRPGK